MALLLGACGGDSRTRGSNNPPPRLCGNDTIDAQETCDGSARSGATCESLGFGPGALGCANDCSDYDRQACAAPLSCGNAAVDGAEVCDGVALAGKSCADFNFNSGALTCLANCAGFELSACVNVSACGDGSIGSGEICDGALLNGQTCESVGLSAGTLACSSDCTSFDTVACGASQTCGNNRVDGTDVCDGADLDGQTCESQGFGPGTLTCQANCAGFVTSACPPKIECGNDLRQQGEMCDGTDLAGMTCEDFGLGSGSLACQTNCEQFDTSACIVPMCMPSCPPTYACGIGDLCQGGDPMALVLNVETVPVSGTITLNGAAPSDLGTFCTSGPDETKAFVRFVETSNGYSFTMDVPCNSATYSFSGVVFPGVYKVSVDGRYASVSALPTTRYIVHDALSITAASPGLVLNVQTLPVSGAIRLNGVAPSDLGTFCTSGPMETKAFVRFRENTHGYSFTMDVPCNSTSYAFSGVVFPGVYKVSVDGRYASVSNLPTTQYVVHDALTISAPVVGQVLNVQTLPVSGTITLNGAAPSDLGTFCTSGPMETKAFVRFRENTHGYSFTMDVPCNSPSYAFSGVVFPGVYKVSVDGRYASVSDLPTTQYIVHDALAVSAPLAGQILNIQTLPVSGTITLNGAAPSDLGTFCNSGPNETKAFVRFRENTHGYSFTMDVPCNSASYAFSGVVFPGEYKVSVDGRYASVSDLPTTQYVVHDALTISGPSAGQVLNVRTLPVSGTIRLNGTAPLDLGTFCTSGPNETKAFVRFRENTHGYSFTMDIPCNSPTYSFSGVVFPGEYKVSVDGRYASVSNLPTSQYVVHNALTITAPLSAQVLNVETLPVSGTITLNGTPPSDLGTFCDSGPSEAKAFVRFRENTNEYSFTMDVLCNSASYAFSGVVFPGVYRVSIDGRYASVSDLPTTRYVVVQALEIR